MKRWLGWQVALAICIGAIAAVGLVRLGSAGMPARIEESLLDLRFRLRRNVPLPEPITLVAIDDLDITAVGRWPWSREVHAKLLDRIGAAKPAVIAYDLLFTEEQSPETDAELASVIARYDTGAGGVKPVPIIVPFAIDLAPSRVMAPRPPPAPPRLAPSAYPRVKGAGPDHLPQAVRLRLPVRALGTRLDMAHVTLVPDIAGSFRLDYPVLRYGDDYFPSLGLEAVRLFRGLRRTEVVVEIGRGIRLGTLDVPTDAGLRMLVNYRPPGSFDTVSAVDVLDNRVPPERFAGRIVLIGTSAIGIGDVTPSPYGPTMPGVERHATLIASLLDGDFIRRDDLTLATDVAVVLLCALLIGLAARRGSGTAALVAALLLAAVALLNVAAFNRFGLWLNLLFPALAILLTLAAVLIGQHFAGAAILARAEEQARRDPLTGLRNRAGLAAWLQAATGKGVTRKANQRVGREVGQRRAGDRGRRRAGGSGSRLLVFMGDLDGFKLVNDTYGHPVGDRLLQEAAARMVHAVRGTDLVARLGGDEFVLIFSLPGGATAESTLPAVRRVFDSVAAPYAIDGVVMRVGLSLGGAIWPDDDPDIGRVMSLADSAVYAAKKQGKGRIALHARTVPPESVKHSLPV